MLKYFFIISILLTPIVRASENFGVNLKVQRKIKSYIGQQIKDSFELAISTLNENRKNIIPIIEIFHRNKTESELLEYLKSNNVKKIPQINLVNDIAIVKDGKYTLTFSLPDLLQGRFFVNRVKHEYNFKKSLEENIKDFNKRKFSYIDLSEFIISKAYAGSPDILLLSFLIASSGQRGVYNGDVNCLKSIRTKSLRRSQLLKKCNEIAYSYFKKRFKEFKKYTNKALKECHGTVRELDYEKEMVIALEEMWQPGANMISTFKTDLSSLFSYSLFDYIRSYERGDPEALKMEKVLADVDFKIIEEAGRIISDEKDISCKNLLALARWTSNHRPKNEKAYYNEAKKDIESACRNVEEYRQCVVKLDEAHKGMMAKINQVNRDHGSVEKFKTVPLPLDEVKHKVIDK